MGMKFTLVALAFVSLTSVAEAQTVAVSMARLGKYRATLLDSIVHHASNVPGLKVDVKIADGDSQKQLAQLRDFAAAKVSAIIVAANDGDLGPEITAIADSAGIPVVYVNNEPANLHELPENQVFVASDEKESGTLQATEVCRMMNGRGKVAVLMGQLFHTSARTRTQDIDDVFARPECKELQIVERQAAYWSRDYADQQMQEWLSAGVKFDAVIANNDEMALGAIRAMKRNGLPMKDVVVAGIDAADDGLKAMIDGDLDVTVLQSAAGQGKAAIEAAMKLASGEKMQRENYVPFELVTPQNIASYLPKSQ